MWDIKITFFQENIYIMNILTYVCLHCCLLPLHESLEVQLLSNDMDILRLLRHIAKILFKDLLFI